MPKKNEIPSPAAAEIIKPADLVAEVQPAEEKAPEPAPEPIPEAAPVETPKETPQPVATPPTPPAATIVTPSQLVADQIPASTLPPVPGEKRGRGRPPGQKNKPKMGEAGASQIVIPAGEPGAENNGEQPAPELAAVNYRQLAEVSFDLTTNTLAGLVGPEWRASGADEREAVLKPLEVYFASKKMEDIPPGAVLCFALASYAAVRMRAPATRSKIAFAWSWLKYKISGKRDFTPKVVNNGNPFAEKN